MFEADIFGFEAMNRRFVHDFQTPATVPSINGFVLGNGIAADQNMNTDALFYDDRFEDDFEDDDSISDCSTSYSYGSDQDSVTGKVV